MKTADSTEKDMEPGSIEKTPVEQKLRRPKQKIWPAVCQEIGNELKEIDMILIKLGLPSHDFHKDRAYPYNDYEIQPNPKTCFSKDFVDYHVFPYLLPAIQSLILFARKNRVFQCRYCTFNALDYIVEHLYNNNPRYPERTEKPVPLYDIPFVKAWNKQYPRKPYPKWLTMTDETAAIIIQRAVRGYLVRKRSDVQEMRQFWKDYQKDINDEKIIEEPMPIYSPIYDSIESETEIHREEPKFFTHSDTCNVCNRFREFIQRQELYRDLAQLSESSIGSQKDSTTDSATQLDKVGEYLHTKYEIQVDKVEKIEKMIKGWLGKTRTKMNVS